MTDETQPTVPDMGQEALQKLASIEAALEAIKASVSPVIPVAQPVGVTDQATPAAPRQKFLSPAERVAVQKELRQRSDQEVWALFSEQAVKRDQGIPFDAWLSMGGAPYNAGFQSVYSQLDPQVQKLLDTSSATALIRNDLDPFLNELYIRLFPAFDRFTKEPANGLIHSWMQALSFGDAQFMSELGTVTDDKGTWQRASTNVAILATRRGVTLKSQFAALQGAGSGFNPEQLEMQNGLRAVAAKMQKWIFSGTTDSGGDSDNELGFFDPNGFTGLRSLLNTARVHNVDGTDTNASIRAAVNGAAVEIMQSVTTNGPQVAYLSPVVKEIIDEQQDKNLMYTNNLTDIALGMRVNSINTVFGPIPLFPIPGDAIGTYEADGNSLGADGTTSVSGETVSDIYLVDESTITLPYLGTPGPTVLDIPIGISGQLTHLFIIFGMWGLALKVPVMNNKVRVIVE